MVIGALGCRPTGVTDSPLASAFALTFANLIQSQQALMGLPAVDARAFHAAATCHRVGPGGQAAGSGSWVCTVTWSVPNNRAPLRDTYELRVTPDGCYTATADGSEAHVGGPTLTTRQGRTFPNRLYAFDGCFDTQ